MLSKICQKGSKMVFKTEIQRFFWVLVALSLMLFPKIGFSLGFGQIKLYSYLNEPLDAEIEILEPADIDTSRLIASLASTDDFKRAELVRPYFLTRLRFEIKPQDKRTVIHITTQDAIKQPFLEFLVVMSWPEGRLVRGYTLLLDPAPDGSSSKRETVRLSDGEASTFQDPNAIKKIQGKMARNQALLKSTQLAKNNEVVHSFDDATLKSLAASDTVNPLEDLFESESTPPDPSTPPIEKSKPVSINSIEQSASEPPIAVTPSRFGMKGIYENKLLLGSGLALLLAVAITVWIFRNARGTLSVADPFGTLETFDEEISIKLVLADQYILIHDIQSAKEILDEVLVRGNINEKEKARALLKKINTP